MSPAPQTPAGLASLAQTAAREGRIDDARTLYRRAIKAQPKNHHLLLELGVLEGSTGNILRARQVLEKALKLAPDDPNTHFNMGQVAHASKQYDRAIRFFTKTLQLEPGYGDAAYALGESLFLKGQPQDALKYLDQALALNPRDHECLDVKGRCLLKLERFEEAAQAFQAALALNPDHVEGKINLATALSMSNNDDKAVAILDRLGDNKNLSASACLKAARVYFSAFRTSDAEKHARMALAHDDVDRPQALLILAETELRKGNMEAALAHTREILSSNRNIAGAYILLARMRKLDASMEKDIRRIARSSSSGIREQSIAARALYFLLDRAGRPDEAFEALRMANSLSCPASDRKNETDFIKQIAGVFSPQFLKERAGQGYSGKGPLFIVGMPRSGTTLTEQILSAHPDVHAGDERIDVSIAWQSVDNFPQGCRQLDAQWAHEHGKTIYDAMFADAGGKTIATDKLPGNYKFIGFIKWLLPDAKFVYCHRNPCDNALSLFEQDFNDRHPYSADLQEIARVYNDHLMIMDHWKNTCGIEIHSVNYDELVQDFEPHARALVEFAGLDWHPDCLSPHKSARQITTASYVQARQPVNSGSLERWRRYEKQMLPFICALKATL